MLRRALLALAFVAAAVPARAADVDLVGTWFVLVHYKDTASNNPDFERWLDRIWEIESTGSRIKWTEYPIVVFQDSSGRFERLGTNRQARSMTFWEPSSRQLEQIHSGLEINTRGSKAKTLHGSEREGWRSRGASGGFSANTITFTETWSIADPAGLPVFSIEEALGGARAETLEGSTEYRTREVLPGGDELRGTYNRDGTRVGTFRIIRSGGVETVKGSGRNNNERVMDMFASQMGGAEIAALLAGSKAPGEVSEETRAQVRDELRKTIEASMKEQGMDPRYFQPQVDDMTDQIMREWERGKSPEQIQRMISNGKIKPRGPTPMR